MELARGNKLRGTHPLISYPGDTTRGATNSGTDGKDLVWTLGEGKEENAFGLLPEVSIMTAPYTTDPAELAPRKLRSNRPALGRRGLAVSGQQRLALATGAGLHLRRAVYCCATARSRNATSHDCRCPREPMREGEPLADAERRASDKMEQLKRAFTPIAGV